MRNRAITMREPFLCRQRKPLPAALLGCRFRGLGCISCGLSAVPAVCPARSSGMLFLNGLFLP